MTTRILLINVHSSCNAGDAALTEVTLEQLQANIPAAKITLSMDDPASHSGDGAVVESLFTWIKQPEGGGRGRWKLASLFWLAPGTLLPILTARISGRPFFRLTPPAWRSTLNAYLQADLVVSKPGGFLYSSGLGLSLLVSLYTMILALAAGKPLYLFPQSIGPFRRGWERWLVRQVLSRARLIMVREEISILELAACGLSRERVQLMPDVAFAFRGAPPAEAAAWRPDLRSFIESRCPLLGITAINWGAQNPTFQHQEAYESACAAAARYFIEKIHGRVIFFPQVWGPFEAQDDRVSARRIARRLADLKSEVLLVDDPVPPRILKSLYGRLDILIGSRMHSNIFALSEGVPVLAIGYQSKTAGIIRMMGLSEWMIPIQETSAETLTQKLDQLWQRRQEVREHIRGIFPELAAGAGEPGRLTAEDYASLQRGNRRAG